MRIAVVSFRTYEYGGVERYAFELVKHLSAVAEVHLFTNRIIGTTEAKVHLIPSLGSRDLFAVNSFMYFLHRGLKRRDFDIIHSMGPLYLYPDVVTAHMCQKRLLLDAQNLFSDFSRIRKYYWMLRSSIAAHFQKISFNNASVVIAVSSQLSEELKTLYGIKNLKVVYPGIERFFFSKPDKKAKEIKRKQLDIDNNAVVLLFVGSQWKRKGLEFLIKALPLLKKNVFLLVVGQGNAAQYKKIVASYNVSRRVKFAGFQKNILDYYAVSDICVLPSSYEGFGYPVLEAMAMGLPVVVSDKVGAAELVRDGKTGYIVEKPENIENLVFKIECLVNSNLSLFSERVSLEAKKYLWDIKIKQVLTIYRRIKDQKI
ncbi:MAG: hypothetical protein B5M53_10945 [Candidatus Cloacimonas sp. 4484_209]|nr:MAG: hypothetical protein B5M53_10945 [Candidatus Cloacimonas sp. 4484_209]